MLAKRLGLTSSVIVSAAILSACAPRIVVHSASSQGSTRADKPGVYYTLPKTRVDANFQIKRVTFVPGKFAATRDELREFPFLKSKLPEGEAWKITCPNDDKAQTRFLIEAATITSGGVPDAEHVYMIELDSAYFRDQDITLKLTPDGIPTAASASVTDHRVDMAISFAADVARIVTLDTAMPISDVRGARKVDAREEAKNELRQIAASRSQVILHGSTSGSVAERLKALADREAELALWWTGKIDEKTVEMKLSKVPDAGSSTPTSSEQIGVLAPCAGVFAKKPDDAELGWPIVSQFSKDSFSDDALAKVIAKDYLSHAATSSTSGANAKRKGFQHGLVYRMPRAAYYTLTLDEPSKNGKPRNLTSARLLVAQFGPVLYLPTRIGGKSTTTGLDFNPDTGGIMVLTAKGTAANAAPLQTAMSDIVKRDDELAELERKQKILDLKAKIKALESPPATP